MVTIEIAKSFAFGPLAEMARMPFYLISHPICSEAPEALWPQISRISVLCRYLRDMHNEFDGFQSNHFPYERRFYYLKIITF